MTPAAILSELRTNLPDYPALNDPATKLEGPAYNSAKSDLYHLQNREMNLDWAVKHYRGDSREITREYEALCFLQDRVKDHEFGFATPVIVLPSQGLLVAQWIPGDSLAGIIRRYASMPDLVGAYVAKSGHWLRQLHNLGDVNVATIPTDELVHSLADDAAKLPRHAVIRRVARRSLSVLQSTAGVLSQIQVPIGLLHGDYKPENILCHNGRVVGIDIALKFENVIVRDISYFLNHMSLGLLARYPWRHAKYSRDLETRFLEGYGWAPMGGSDIALSWFRVYSSLNQLITRLEGASFVGSNWFAIWAIALLVRGLTARLRDAAR